jgi:hypothetical protein
LAGHVREVLVAHGEALTAADLTVAAAGASTRWQRGCWCRA